MADRIVAAFELPVAVKAKEIFVRPSLGIALAGPDAEENPGDADELVRNADAAMYIAKRDGKGGYRVFEAAMHESVLERLELRAELQRAIETNQFELYFQPVMRPSDRRRSRGSRRSCAGITRRAGSSSPGSSSRWPRRWA